MPYTQSRIERCWNAFVAASMIGQQHVFIRQLKRAEEFVVPEGIAARMRFLLQQQFDESQRLRRLRVVAHRDVNARFLFKLTQNRVRVNRIVRAIND